MKNNVLKRDLSKLSSKKIISLIEKNNRRQYIQLFSDCPDVRLVQKPDCLCIESEITNRYFNRVFYSAFEKESLIKRVKEIIQKYRDLKVPSIWFVGPWNNDDNLENILKEAGFQLSREETGMAIDLLKNQSQLKIAAGLDIRPAQSIRDLNDWLKPVAESFQYTPQISQFLLKTFKEKKLFSHPDWKFFIGYLDDKPVTASRLFLHAGTAGIHHVGTKPEYRGRGLGNDMTIYPLLEAMKLGYGIGVLRASSMGKNIYQKIGFQEFSTYRFYTSP